MEEADQKAVLELFDISQENREYNRYLTLTMPYSLWEILVKYPEKSCLTTKKWKEIQERL
ncbi:MAG: hypothetical protein ACI4W2_11765 [Eubacterium sp.]